MVPVLLNRMAVMVVVRLEELVHQVYISQTVTHHPAVLGMAERRLQVEKVVYERRELPKRQVTTQQQVRLVKVGEDIIEVTSLV